MATSHSGAHMDALAHMTVGDDSHWYGGGSADARLTDAGPVFGDASKLPPLFTRGVLVDAPSYRGVDRLPKGSAIDAAELEAICAAEGVTVQPWDVVPSEPVTWGSGPMSRRWRPTRPRARIPPPPAPALERGVAATGTDTETYEVQPAPVLGAPANPQPVHTLLLIENGIGTRWRASIWRRSPRTGCTSSCSLPCP